MPQHPDKTVALVESEKAAIICSAMMPQYLWLAAGGKSQFNGRLTVLNGRKIIAFPDIDAYHDWLRRTADFPHLELKVSDLLENTYVFGELDYINNLRNRIAHHGPICFGNPVCIDTSYAKNRYNRIMTLFGWMGIDGSSLLYGLGHPRHAGSDRASPSFPQKPRIPQWGRVRFAYVLRFPSSIMA